MAQNPVVSLQPLVPQASVVIVLVDDAAHLQAAWGAEPALAANTHWVLVACAPRMAQRPSKWGSHRVREHWRARWSTKLFDEIGGWMHARGQAFTPVLAEGPLPEFTNTLMQTHGQAQVLDLRRPKGVGLAPQPLLPAVSGMPANRLFSLVASLLGVGLLLGGIAE